jgi:hypothetical protein
MNAWNERGRDSKNFGARITGIGVVAEKIWLKDVLGAFSVKLVFALGIQNWFHKEKGYRLGPQAVNHSLARSMVNRSPWPAPKLTGAQPLAAPVTGRPSWQQEEAEGRLVKLTVGRTKWWTLVWWWHYRGKGSKNLLCEWVEDEVGCHFIGRRREATGREGGGRRR